MAKITRTLSAKTNQNGTAEIFLRVTVSRTRQFRIRSGIFVRPERFRKGAFVMPRSNQREINELHETERRLRQLEADIVSACISVPAEQLTKQALLRLTDRYGAAADGGPMEERTSKRFFSLWDEFLKARELSENRRNSYRSIARALHRYEMHRQLTQDEGFFLDVDRLNADDILSIETFLKNEWLYYDEYPEIYTAYPAELRTQHKTHKPQRRGNNIIVCTLKKIKAFCNWCNSQGKTGNKPFEKFGGSRSEQYGTPYYLTIEERDRIADFDLSSRPQLAVQRDIFIFQCLVGCRVSDLKRLRKSSVSGDMVEYIPRKTKKDRAQTVRVPLCARAQEIISRYAQTLSEALLPCISDQRYNDAIKEICRLCGIDRKVTIINSVTGQDERKPIYEVASSHMARRTFIGILYKQVKDPNLIGALSGHKEGSRAFARYREIDDDIKRGLIELMK